MVERRSSNSNKAAETETAVKRFPSSKPPFTLADLKKAIPPHCFKRSIPRSFSYLVFDLIVAAVFYHIAATYFPLIPKPLSYVAWPAYWFVQGSVLTGVWVIGHECGHHAFSEHQWLDDLVGFVLHSALLTPYFSWKISHRRHHANTCSLERDEVYIPRKKSQLRWWYSSYLNNPPGRLLALAYTILLGWPSYLTFNLSGREYNGFACHFYPMSPIYSDRERAEVFASDVGLLAVCFALYKLIMVKGMAWVFCVYGAPVMVVNGFFITITYLHHTHLAVPRYDSSEWDWLRGALATMDRDFGLLNKVFHNVTDTHVTHHLISTIPHYHAMEANNAIRPVLGDYYHIDRTPVVKALWREAKECVYIEADDGEKNKGVFWFNTKL
uniref:Omega-6 desaturase n=1 Tax=Linum usitatissimum TaxID=4006 RepID=I6XCP4_LINUS|nr:omega-6 desaturase [Linum usitatissimum]AMY26637.1 fatty acid desaturase 2-oxidoreductase activity, omega-6 desaturase [Linum usitatissimum]